LWSAIAHHGGVIIETEGDGLTAIFDCSEHKQPLATALLALDKAKRDLQNLHEHLILQGLIDESIPVFEFRCGIASGQLKPIWRTVDGMQVSAAWVEIGNTNAFVDSTRMMEVERTLAEADKVSIVTIAGNVAIDPQIPLSGHWLFLSRTFEGKHSHIYSVSAYVPSAMAKGQNELSDVVSLIRVA
jgi:hypothetical protein